MIFSKRTTLILLMLILGAAALAGAFFSDNSYETRPTGEYSDEEICKLPYFDILAPKGENRNLLSDVVSYSLGDGYIHLYLPDNISDKSVTVYIRDIDGNYLARRTYDFSQKVMIGQWEVLLDRHNLPILYFDSDDHNMYTVMTSSEEKNIICDGNMHICVSKAESRKNNWLIDLLEMKDSGSRITKASLQGRGVSSWKLCDTKKSYSLRLDKPMNLLGLGSNKNWNLIGNAFDVSLLKNITFNNLSKEIGIDYQPNMQSVNLYVDGQYQGVYTLTTKVTVDKNRISLNEGDYFYQKHSHNYDQPFTYSSTTWYDDGEDHPVAELIYPENASQEDFLKASEVFQSFINAVETPEQNELSDVCDVKELAKYYWIQEASMNLDGWERCVYMYYTHRDGKMHVGPIWDMDLTLGSNYSKLGVDFSSPQGWKIREGGWYTELFKNDSFRNAVYEEYFNGGIRDILLNGINEFEVNKEILGADGYMNYLFYGHSNKWDAALDYGDTYDEYCDNMIDFYRRRIAWIDSQMSMEAP